MNNNVEITGQNAGLHIVIQVNSGYSADELVQIAEKSGVKVYSTTDNWISGRNEAPSYCWDLADYQRSRLLKGSGSFMRPGDLFIKINEKPIDPHAT